MNRGLIIAAAVLLALAGTFLAGARYGRAALQDKLDAAQVQAQIAAAETTKALAVAEQKRRELSAQLEDAANAQPISSPACLPVERVRRLNLH